MSPQDLCKEAGIVHDIHGVEHIDPPYSHFWVWLVCGILVYLLIKCQTHRSGELLRAKEADATCNENESLTAGNRFIRGQVEFAEGSTNAVSVHVKQDGTETESKNGWGHKWTEVSRRTLAEPFYLRCSNGERVRVEPDANVLLVDEPDTMEWTEETARTRIAELSENETVIVEGLLTRGHDPESQNRASYRGNTQGWLMRPPVDGRMQISAEDLGIRHRIRAEKFGSTFKQMLVVLAIVQSLFASYNVGLFFGTDTCARVANRDSYTTTDSKGRKSTHYRLSLDVPWPTPHTFERDLAHNDWVQVNREAIVAFRRVPSWDYMSMPGYGTSANLWLLVISSLAAFVGVGFYGNAVSSRRWYEGRLDDTGSGRLPKPPAPESAAKSKQKKRRTRKTNRDAFTE